MACAQIKEVVMKILESVYAMLVLKGLNVKVIMFCDSLRRIWIFDNFVDKSCPGAEETCNGNGECDHTTGQCICNEGNQGFDCSGDILSR